MQVEVEGGRFAGPVIVVHGGAGPFERVQSAAEAEALERVMADALDAGWAVLEAGGGALDAAVEAVAVLESSGRFNAGRGAVPTTGGHVEFDAGVMDGSSSRLGAICAATYPANPIRVARAVAEVGGLPRGPVLLAGRGADDFAEREGFEAMRPEALTAAAGTAPESGAGAGARARSVEQVDSPEGTVGAVALDAAGHVAAATSTGGISGQMPGRVGDSPVPGAGVYAREHGGSGVAVSGTGSGEVFLATGFGHRIAWQHDAGAELGVATAEALEAVGELGGEGGGIALSTDGVVVAAFSSRCMARGWRTRDGVSTGVLRRVPR